MVQAPGSPSRTVRHLTRADLPAAAALHAAELAEGFLAQLGPAFLRRYLATFLSTPGAVALGVHDQDGTLAGFVVGSTRRGHNQAALRLHARSLLPSAVAGLARHPWLAMPFLRTRGRRYLRAGLGLLRRPAPAAGPTSSGPTSRGVTSSGPTADLAVLLHVAVAPAQRGRGTGGALVRAFADAAREAGSRRVLLVAFGEKDFYLRLGWTQVAARRDGADRLVVTYGLDL